MKVLLGMRGGSELDPDEILERIDRVVAELTIIKRRVRQLARVARKRASG